MRKHFILFLLVIPIIGVAQEKKNFTVKLHGFVKSDLLFDSRQTVNVREGHFLLYPKNEDLDKEGNDINAQPTLNMLSIQTRLKVLATGPDVWGAKTIGYIEGEFFGTTNADVNGFRLRHAFVKLQWPKTMIMVGQYWNPLFNVRCYPGTVSFNTGAPFQPFARNPQLRFNQQFGKFNINVTAYWQHDFVSTGPSGSSSVYLRNSAIPIFNLRFEFYTKNESTGNEFLAGVSANYKSIIPRIMSDSTYQTPKTENVYKTDTRINSVGFSAYFKAKLKPVTIKLNGFYGGDAFDIIMIGGYAVKEITDPVKGFVTYTPICVTSYWIDLHTNGKRFQYGLFAGYSKNLGPREDVMADGNVYARSANIDYAYRVSGRMIYNNGKFRLAPEVEYTVAAYATEYGKPLEITNSNPIGNFRVLVGFYYFF